MPGLTVVHREGCAIARGARVASAQRECVDLSIGVGHFLPGKSSVNKLKATLLVCFLAGLFSARAEVPDGWNIKPAVLK